MKNAIAFLRGSDPPDYGSRFSRLRWARAIPSCGAVEVSPGDAAREALVGSEVWLVVRDESALPWPLGRFPVPGSGRVLVAGAATDSAPVPHTLREFEMLAPGPGATRVEAGPAPAIAFRTGDFPAGSGETISSLIDRLLASRVEKECDPEFRVFSFADPSESERPELTRHVPAGCRRLLDVGCGAGGSSAALRRRSGALHVTGIERNERAAALARESLDRVFVGDAQRILTGLADARETFDAFLFADVLEHLEDPAGALSRALALAAPGAILVASVPNAGHLSLVRDLVVGRFDPVPAGLADAGHLRWFTRTSLAEALEGAGWKLRAIESWPGAEAADAEPFLSHFSRWAGLDRESLATYQWIAVAIASGDRESDDRSIG